MVFTYHSRQALLLCPWPQLFLRTQASLSSIHCSSPVSPSFMDLFFQSLQICTDLSHPERALSLYVEQPWNTLSVSFDLLKLCPFFGCSLEAPLGSSACLASGLTDPLGQIHSWWHSGTYSPSMLINLFPSLREDYAPIETTHLSLHWLIS